MVDSDQVISLLEKAVGHLGAMLEIVEGRIEGPEESPRLMKGDWKQFQDTVRDLMAAQYSMPNSWQIMAFAQVPVSPVHNPAEGQADLETRVREEEYTHGVKLAPKEWSDVRDEMRAAIEVLRIVGLSGKEHEDARAKKGASRKPTVNERMKAEMASDLETVKGWTAKQWAKKLDCGQTTIKDTETWKSLSLLRQTTRAEKATDRHRKPKGSDLKKN